MSLIWIKCNDKKRKYNLKALIISVIHFIIIINIIFFFKYKTFKLIMNHKHTGSKQTLIVYELKKLIY